MAKIRKIISAGKLTIETIYPAPRPRDSYAARQGRKNVTTQAMQMLNKRYAYQRLELQLAANILPGDFNVVLTYTPERLPSNREQVRKDLTSFFRKLRRNRGKGLTYFYKIEHKHKAGNRYHIHIYMSGGPENAKALETIWGNGRVFCAPIDINPDNPYEQLARYMVKEAPDKLGQHLYDHSRHIRQPECDRLRVGDDAVLHPPDGCVILNDTGRVDTVYGSFRTIKYMEI